MMGNCNQGSWRRVTTGQLPGMQSTGLSTAAVPVGCWVLGVKDFMFVGGDVAMMMMIIIIIICRK
jgi:hypothetical protein